LEAMGILASDNGEPFVKTIALQEALGIISLMTNPDRGLIDGAKMGLRAFLTIISCSALRSHSGMEPIRLLKKDCLG
jgi:hypothetical protein